MKNYLDLIQYGKDISNRYITDNINLTDSLEKVAFDYNLNKEEMNRVAETANIETYLKLINKSNDKYIEFPLANAKEAYNNLHEKTAKLSNNDDYSDKQSKLDFSFDLYNTRVDMKDPIPDINKEHIKVAMTLKDTLVYLSNQLNTNLVKLGNLYNNITDISKQYILSKSATPYEVEHIVKVASNDELDLKPFFEKHAFEYKAGNIEYKVNEDTDLYKLCKEYEELNKQTIKIAEACNLYEAEFNNLNEQKSLGFQKAAAGKLQIAKVTAKALGAGALIGATTVGVGALAHNTVKTKEVPNNILNKDTAILSAGQAKNLR